jgi:hypothetical protein
MQKQEQEKPKAASEVARLCGAAMRTVQKWASKNGVLSIANHYLFYQSDIERFNARPRPGRKSKNGGGQ